MSAREAAQKYVAAINAAEVNTLVGLFAPGAVLRNPAGTFDTPEAIRGFYEGVVLAGKTQITIASLVEESDTVARAELDATSPLSEPGTPPMRAIDVFTVDANGAIVTLDITYP